MKKALFTFAMLMGFSLMLMSQTSYIYQPDTVRLYYNSTVSPYNGNDNYGKRGIRFTYDSDGLLTEYFEHEDVDEYGQSHVNYYNIYRYDERHNMVWMDHSEGDWGAYWGDEKFYVYQDGMLQWYTRYKYGQFIYDWDCDDSIYYHYSPMSLLASTEVYKEGELTNISNYEYSDSETRVTTEGYADGIWQPLNVVTKRFSSEGRLLSVETEDHDKPSTLVTYTYDELGRQSSILTQEMEDGEWNNSMIIEYGYYTNGRIQSAQLSTWQSEESVATNRASYELDTNGNVAIVTFEKMEGGKWVEGSWQKGFYVFSDDYLKSQNDILCRRDAYRIELHYAETSNPSYDVKEHPNGLSFATIHPNPASNTLTITGESLRQIDITNMLGQRVVTHEAEGPQATIDISTLPTGIYFVGITDENGKRCVKKVVKE